MIPVTVPINKRRYSSPSFTCFHCKGEFWQRHVKGKLQSGQRLFCVDCQDLVETARRKAHYRLYARIKKGLMPPASAFKCSDCGAQADRFDHRDYSKPYDVEPVCCTCNRNRGPAILGDAS